MKLSSPRYCLSALRTLEIGPITPADLSTLVEGVADTSENGITTNDLMLSRFPALITPVIDLTSSTRNTFIQRSRTAAHALEYSGDYRLSTPMYPCTPPSSQSFRSRPCPIRSPDISSVTSFLTVVIATSEAAFSGPCQQCRCSDLSRSLRRSISERSWSMSPSSWAACSPAARTSEWCSIRASG